MHSKAVVDVSRGSGVKFSWGRLVGVYWETHVSSIAVPEDVNLKFRSTLNQIFTNHGCLHCVVLNVLYEFKEKRDLKSIALSSIKNV